MSPSIKEKVAAWLLEPGHTKQDLAARLGITVQTLNNRLDDSYDWQWREVKLLADLFKCPVDALR